MIMASLLALFLFPGAARAEWLEASSDHFVIYAEDNERDLRKFSDQLERYHAAMALLFHVKAPPPSPSNRVTVYVVGSEQAVRKIYGANSKYIGGFYLPRAGGSLAIIPRVDAAKSATDGSMTTLLHEYAHHFMISATAMQRPKWFTEGAAEFFSSSSFSSDGSMVVGRPALHRAGELFYAPDVKVADLLDPTAYDKRTHRNYDAFYGKSWLLYHYLTFDPSRQGQFSRYLQLLDQGKGQREAAAEAFGDFEKLEKDVERYLMRPKMSALPIAGDRLIVGPITVRRLTAGEAAIMPVRIRSKRGVDEDSAKSVVAEARAIAAQYPRDVAVLGELAEAEYDAGNDKETIAAADAALAVDPSQTNAYIQKGYALFREAQETDGDKALAYRRARAPFVALNRLENDHPLPLIYYYRSFVEQGEQPPKLAIDGLIHAVELAPFDFGLRMNLGWALIRLGRVDDAKIILAPVAFNPHGGGMAQRATEMIARLDKDPSWKGPESSAGLDDDGEDGEGEDSGGASKPGASTLKGATAPAGS